MEIKCYPFGPLQANAYLVLFGTDAFLIDPCVKTELIDLSGMQVRGIFCTHGHFDHIIEAERTRSKTSAVIMAHEEECPMILTGETSAKIHPSMRITIEPPVCALKDGDVLHTEDFGFSWQNPVEIRIIHTPGHSRGSMCILFTEEGADQSNVLFSGDTVFYDTIGRTDLGGSMEDMRRSLAKLSLLPDEVCVYPGHGPSTSIGREKRHNPYFTEIL